MDSVSCVIIACNYCYIDDYDYDYDYDYVPPIVDGVLVNDYYTDYDDTPDYSSIYNHNGNGVSVAYMLSVEFEEHTGNLRNHDDERIYVEVNSVSYTA